MKEQIKYKAFFFRWMMTQKTTQSSWDKLKNYMLQLKWNWKCRCNYPTLAGNHIPFGWNILETNRTVGGLFGYSSVNSMVSLKVPENKKQWHDLIWIKIHLQKTMHYSHKVIEKMFINLSESLVVLGMLMTLKIKI